MEFVSTSQELGMSEVMSDLSIASDCSELENVSTTYHKSQSITIKPDQNG